MEFTIKIDITERLEKCLHGLANAILFSGTAKTLSKYVDEPRNPEPEEDNVFVGYTVNVPYEQAVKHTETENAPEAKSEQPAEVKPEAVEAAAQNDNTETADAKAEAAAQNDNAEQEPSKEPEKKPAKKRTSKKAENLAVETPKEPEPVITTSEAESAPEAKSDQPADAKPEAVEPKTPDNDDPMCGMTVMDAMQAVMSEISEKGLEMADVNARVRARAAEAGIAYSSIICLIKAIGYKEARRVALGEK